MTLVYDLLVAPKLCTPTSLHSTSHQKIHALTHTHFLWRLHWKVYSNWRTKNFWLRFSLKLTRDGILENRKQGKIWQFWTLHLTCFLYYPWSEASRRGEVSQEIEVGDASGDASWVKGKVVNFLAFVALLKVNSTTTSHILNSFY